MVYDEKTLTDYDLFDFGNNFQISGMIFSGKGKNIICPIPDTLEGQGTIYELIHMTTDDWAKLLRQTDLLETEILQKAPDGKLVKIILRKSQRQIDQGVSWEVFRRDGYRCRYCGKDDVPLTVDHVVLWEDGGPSTKDNLVSACRKCNKTRGNMQYEEWIKSTKYLSLSKNLMEQYKLANLELLQVIDKIPRRQHIQSR
ncbi:MAG TPA: HNH endonuclease [Methanofastidiosum sp.]|nr:HNH endonuclease [Methanofastidiosum sp.]